MTQSRNAVSAMSGIAVSDSTLVHTITEFVRDTETELLFNHSSRVFFFGAIAGQQRGLTLNPELLYVATMFQDVGLMPSHRTTDLRFEVDGANAAANFLQSYNLNPCDIEKIWTGLARHNTPGVPEFMHPVIALIRGVEIDVLGLTYDRYPDATREAVVAAVPRTPAFNKDIVQACHDGIKHKPDITSATSRLT